MTEKEKNEYQELYNELCSQYGLHTEFIGNQQRAWYQDYDFVMNLNVRETSQDNHYDISFEIPTKVLLNEYMDVPRFFDYLDITQKKWKLKKKRTEKIIDEVFGKYKLLLAESKLKDIKKDFV